ncbi:MAG: gamma-glutamyl-gamma-aminobutyrate hydrolase family protein [Alphaproteobacteria bacterium]|jgi:putative glutamine amidotransferase|nr:gamma-glutamyl-gamma-aminobutyrate hydrolase family protein [Alphaproteobacteria bacterium]
MNDRVAPLIGVTACVKHVSPHDFHVAGDKYLAAVAEAAGTIPVVLPAFGADTDFAGLCGRLDGLFVTGSSSNVEPHHYDGSPSAAGTLHDARRDATTLPLIRAALDAGLPLLAVCRGCQELNVALGGTLHQTVHDVPGRHDHRADESQPLDVQYGPAHPVRLVEGGALHTLIGEEEIIVNSIHSQGIDSLGKGLVIEATALDGQIEAVRVDGAETMALAVQWHPEWHYWESKASQAIFAAFGAACREGIA